MNLHPFFEPSSIQNDTWNRESIGASVMPYPDEPQEDLWDDNELVLIGFGEARLSPHENYAKSPDIIREAFYTLFCGDFPLKMIDLGNMILGDDPQESYRQLGEILAFLARKNQTVMLLGASHDGLTAVYQAFENRQQMFNLVNIDQTIDVGDPEVPMNHRNYLGHLMVGQPNFLFSFANIGHQNYLVDQMSLRLLESLNFDTLRLGLAQAKITEAEPLIRYADALSVDMNAVRHSDAPANPYTQPVGLYGEELCQMMRFAGMSERLRYLALFEYDPLIDPDSQNAKLMAIMLWCFVEGFYSRKFEYPYLSKDQLVAYHVQIEGHDSELIFYKSRKSNRWWMDIPCSEQVRENFPHQYIVPCSYADYEMAQSNEIPDRWMNAYKRLNP